MPIVSSKMKMSSMFSKQEKIRRGQDASSSYADLNPMHRCTSKAKNAPEAQGLSSPSSISTGQIEAKDLLQDVVCSPDLLPKKVDQFEPWCLPILRTEALLRLSKPYITATAKHYDCGSVPPAFLDAEVETKALQIHGLTEGDAVQYRKAASSLDVEDRADIFFLRANDRLFRPDVQLAGKLLSGLMHRVDCSPCGAQYNLGALLADLPRALVVASTSS